MVADLVAAPLDVAADVGIALDDPRRDEPGDLETVAVQHVEDARRAGPGTVGPHAHGERPVRQRRVAMDPGALAVEVERERHGAALALGPLDRLCHGTASDADGYTVSSRRGQAEGRHSLRSS